LCDRIAIINHGKLIANKPTREMVDMAREKIVVLTLDRDIATPPAHPAFTKSRLTGDRQVEITYNKDNVNAGEVMSLVQGQGFAIEDVSTREADLEDVFVTLTSAPARAA
jgi:ABC-2 type transport system ATP-binding protein